MEALFTAVTGCFGELTGVITQTLTWAISEPLVVIGLTASIVGVGIGLFGSAKGAARA